jgi:hypothetical protein
MRRYKSVNFIVFVSIWFVACVDSNKSIRSSNLGAYQADSLHSVIESTISDYIKQYNIDRKERLLTLNFYNDGVRQFVYLSQARRISTAKEADFYFITKEKVIVLIFLGAKNNFHSLRFAGELDELLRRNNVHLADDHLNYDPPQWEILENCEGRFEVSKAIKPFELNFLPCGYYIAQDSVELTRYSLIKKAN